MLDFYDHNGWRRQTRSGPPLGTLRHKDETHDS
jgi:hypothetical protein